MTTKFDRELEKLEWSLSYKKGGENMLKVSTGGIGGVLMMTKILSWNARRVGDEVKRKMAKGMVRQYRPDLICS